MAGPNLDIRRAVGCFPPPNIQKGVDFQHRTSGFWGRLGPGADGRMPPPTKRALGGLLGQRLCREPKGRPTRHARASSAIRLLGTSSYLETSGLGSVWGQPLLRGRWPGAAPSHPKPGCGAWFSTSRRPASASPLPFVACGGGPAVRRQRGRGALSQRCQPRSGPLLAALSPRCHAAITVCAGSAAPP